MKSIVYILLGIIISSIIVSAFPKNVWKNQQSLTIQCTDKNPSRELLDKSGAIIKSRLEDYGVHRVNVEINKVSSCIRISFDSQVNVNNLIALLTSKGRIEFYETYDRFEVIQKSDAIKELSSLLNTPEDDKESFRFSGILGYCKQDKKPEVERYLKDHDMSIPGYEINFCWSEYPNENGDYYLYMLKSQASMDNSCIVGSAIQSELPDKKPELMISFDSKGARIWKDLSKRNIGKSVAIVLDKKVMGAPVVKSEINTGKCVISGNFSWDEINRMNALIKNGVLPLNFELKN